MKRKPDILWVLALVFGLGVVTSAYAQSYWASQSDAASSLAMQIEAKR